MNFIKKKSNSFNKTKYNKYKYYRKYSLNNQQHTYLTKNYTKWLQLSKLFDNYIFLSLHKHINTKFLGCIIFLKEIIDYYLKKKDFNTLCYEELTLINQCLTTESIFIDLDTCNITFK
jgi:hypothetical protein